MTMDLAGKRCVGFARAHGIYALDQLDRQIKILMDFAQSRGMVWVGEIRIAASSSNVKGRKAIQELIDRQDRERFCDVLLVADFAKLTRGGAANGIFLTDQLRSHGVSIMSPDGTVGRYENFIDAIQTSAANHYSRMLSLAIQKARQFGVSKGNTPFVALPPFAIDRLYVDLNGKKLHICRTTIGGSQMLSCDSNAVLREFPPGHGYRKRADERIVYIPGAQEVVAAVQEIFQRRFTDSWNARKIASHLNNGNVRDLKGKLWTGVRVQRIIQNPLYIGVGIAFKNTTLGPDRQVEEPYRRPILRPAAEWLFSNHPQLRNAFISEEIVEKVKRYQLGRLGLNVDCGIGPAAQPPPR